MVRKEFYYRGYKIDDLMKMDDSKLAEVAPSVVRRRFKRGLNYDKRIVVAMDANANGKYDNKPIRTHSRDLIILPKMVGLKFSVYRGNSFDNIDISEEMIFKHLGEFVDTRKRPVHSKAGIGATKSSKNVGKK